MEKIKINYIMNNLGALPTIPYYSTWQSRCFECQLQVQPQNNVFQHLDLFIPNCGIVWDQTRWKSWSTWRSIGCSYQPVTMQTMNQTMMTTVAQDLTPEKIETCNKVVEQFLFAFSRKNFWRVKEESFLILFNWY